MEQTMTRQEVFNTVYKHLLTQNQRSMGEPEGSCAYRGLGGLKCAVGCLITDEEYRPWMDGCGVTEKGEQVNNTTVHSLCEKGLFPARLIPHQYLLEELQSIHDTSDIPIWKVRLDGVARKYHLKIPE